MGIAIAENTGELFQDLPEDHPFFDRLELMDSSDIPHYRALYQRTRDVNFDDVNVEDRYAWIRLSFKYNEPQYRFGLLDDSLMRKVLHTQAVTRECARQPESRD
jgi:putative ABC transport system ATP-binding protein